MATHKYTSGNTWFSTIFQVLEAAKRLHLKEHSVLDGSGNVVKLAAPVECKGIVGSDDRYNLDFSLFSTFSHSSNQISCFLWWTVGYACC